MTILVTCTQACCTHACEHTSTRNLHAKGGSGEVFKGSIGRQIECGSHENRRNVCILLRRTRRTHPITRSISACTAGPTGSFTDSRLRGKLKSIAGQARISGHTLTVPVLETPEASVEQTDAECDRLSVPVGLMFSQNLRSFCMHLTALSTWSGSMYSNL